MPTLADKKYCTACGACIAACPKSCIDFQLDDLDNRYPVIDKKKCIDCKKCEKICNSVQTSVKYTPIAAYAAWSTDAEIRRTSASGGVASALYREFFNKGYHCFGAVQTTLYDVKILEERQNIGLFRGSKYVHSDMHGAYSTIKKYLQSSEHVFIVALPCQIAGLRAYLGKEWEHLITADLICHGTCSNEYLKQHIETIEKKTGKKTVSLSFRDPEFDSEKFYFTLRDEKQNVFYQKIPRADDVYQIGYHEAIIYRENCYHCQYACQQRIGDITLGDYWMLGGTVPFEYDKRHVSLVLANSATGQNIMKTASQNNSIVSVERPVSESVEAQGQLNRPSKITLEHSIFNRLYSKTHDFDKMASIAMKASIFFNLHKMHRIKRYYKKLVSIIYRK